MVTENANSEFTPIAESSANELVDYDVSLGAVLREAWEKTNGLKGSFWAAGGMVFLAMLVVNIIGTLLGVGGALMGGDSAGASIAVMLVLQLVMMAITYPLMTGVLLLGIHRAVDLPISYKSVFGYFAYTLPLIGAGILTIVLIMLGYVLLIIPGIYLSLAYMFVLPLIVEKNLGVWEAMEASRKAVTQHWFKLFFLFLIMMVIVVISVIPLGIGLIWTYPMMVAMMGVLYRDIFGVDVVEGFA